MRQRSRPSATSWATSDRPPARASSPETSQLASLAKAIAVTATGWPTSVRASVTRAAPASRCTDASDTSGVLRLHASQPPSSESAAT
ncbi:MAG: hypothetical protein U0271_36945 [Polyangiaceae bacterium]